MTVGGWLGVRLYLQAHTLSGLVYRAYEERLLDLLNGVSVRRRESRGRFLELREVTIHYVDGKEEKLPSAYINKATIQLAATQDGDLVRSIGAKPGRKPYPFMPKSSIPVKLWTPDYALTGNIYRASHQETWRVLEESMMFLPLTDAEIRALADGASLKVPFVAVNREQILWLQEEEMPIAQGAGAS